MSRSIGLRLRARMALTINQYPARGDVRGFVSDLDLQEHLRETK
jgi:hypothetical protein